MVMVTVVVVVVVRLLVYLFFELVFTREDRAKHVAQVVYRDEWNAPPNPTETPNEDNDDKKEANSRSNYHPYANTLCNTFHLLD